MPRFLSLLVSLYRCEEGFLPLLIGGLAGLGSGIANAISGSDTNAKNIAMQRETNAQNRDMAYAQMGFQKHMSDTAHQREVADLHAAGLNPMLGMMQGGASSPQGVSAQAQAPSADNFAGPAVSQGLSSALQVMKLAQEAKSVDADVAYKDAAALKEQASAQLAVSNAKVAEQQVGLTKADTSLRTRQARSVDIALPAQQAQSKLEAKRASMDEKAAVYDGIISRAAKLLGIVTDAASAGKPKYNIRLGGAPQGSKYRYTEDDMLNAAGPRGIPTN